MKKLAIFVQLLCCIGFSNLLAGTMVDTLYSARIQDFDRIELKVHESFDPNAFSFKIQPETPIYDITKEGNLVQLHTSKLDLTQTYYIHFSGQIYELQPSDVLNHFYSDKAMGCTWNDNETTFRVFAPRATRVTLELFETLHADPASHELVRDDDGVWELNLPGTYIGQYYGYRVDGPQSDTEIFDFSKLLADPYSHAVATKNHYLHPGKTLIWDHSTYDWEGDQPLGYQWEDFIIYEAHVRDLTADPSSGAPEALRGSYKALLDGSIRGGLGHIRELGVNAVEFLPMQDFGNIEIPFEKEIDGVINTWNPYARNHWGYMTSYFFAPESYYASGQTLTPDEWIGVDGRQVNEFKDVVKEFHRNGIAVIMDVVYNHVSQYDQNCFKYIDKKYYFRLNEDATFQSASGTGNDFKTERPMSRKMIVESVKFWMQEYHIDGFRFDLAAMIDWETIDAIREAALEINPNVILIAEPWGGGGYAPVEFSQHDWAAWNDQIRNGVKGQYPIDNHGFIFGKYFDFNSLETMKRYVKGTLVQDDGMFVDKAHSVNYLESHDDHTLGDFIRIALTGKEVVSDVDSNAVLPPEQLKLNKLAALFLFVSQGPIMIHEGQEWARSKVIAPTPADDPNVGHIDHNSYNKDNETNWLNFEHADMNTELIDYYRGLIEMRKTYPAFRHSEPNDFKFYHDKQNHFAFAFQLSGSDNTFFVVINGSRDKAARFKLPDGPWDVLANQYRAGRSPLDRLKGTLTVPPSSGLVLKK